MAAGSPDETPTAVSSGVRRGRETAVANRPGNSQSFEEMYDNAVRKRADLPDAQPPRNFALVRKALLGVTALCVVAGFASFVFGCYVESRHGLKVPGMRDVPFDVSTGAVFLGGLGMSISLTLAAIVLRNWHPVLLTYAFFALMMVVSNFALYTMMVPGPNLALRRAASWRSMPPELHLHFFEQFNCCGYSSALVNNYPTCNLAAIGKGQTVTASSSPAPAAADLAAAAPATAPALVAPALTPQKPTSGAKKTPTGGPTANRPATARRIVRRQQQPAAAPPPIPQFTNPAPLVSDSKPTGPPTPPSFRPPLPDSGVDFCQASVDPALDAALGSFRGYYIFGGLLSMAQLGLLGVYRRLLGTWKRSRGVARW